MLAKLEKTGSQKNESNGSKQKILGRTSINHLFGLIATGLLLKCLLPAAYVTASDPGGGDWPMWAARPISQP